MKIRLIDTIKEFKTLEPYWNNLLHMSGSDHIHLTFEWMWVWWNHFGDENKLFILEASDDDQVIGIAPFCISKNKISFKNFIPIKRIAFIGSGISDSLDFIIIKEYKKVIELFF